MGIIITFFQNLMCFALFFCGYPRRTHFMARFLPLSALCAWLVYSIHELLQLPLLGLSSQLIMLLYFLTEFATLLALFRFCFQVGWEQALYSASAGRAAQHLIYSALKLIQLKTGYLLSWLPSGTLSTLLRNILLYVPFCVVIYFCFARKMDTSYYGKSNFHRKMNMLSVIILFVCMVITRFVRSSDGWDVNVIISQNLYAITCCFLCLFMQFELCRQEKLSEEIETIRGLWQADSKQLAERKDTIELINMKCHDIRHRLEDCRLPVSASEGDELASLIRIYDQFYHTGNQTLDVLLTDRTLLCEKDHIQLSFTGNGGSLNFLAETEVYSLFGNALGNAAEAVRTLEEAKRQISVIVRSAGDIVSINVTNYYQGELCFEDGLPVTTHSDPQQFHGYGMKSMRAIAQKYGGELTVKAEDGVFRLTIWLVSTEARQAQ